ncbi:MAG: FkbM family methyltransferase [Lachnospiraceae bacterium]|nr:FkbM family methyltransferase [Lachnospiraceae bacterium]
MKTMEMIKYSDKFYNSLVDDISREIFEIRMQYALDRDIWKMRHKLIDIYEEPWIIPELDRLVNQYSDYKHIVIFGAGLYGKYVHRLLMHSKYKDEDILFCDNDPLKQKGNYDGIRVLSIDELYTEYSDSVIIVAIAQNAEAAIRQLAQGGIFGKKILISFKGTLHATRGNQYFDCFAPIKDEIFIDCGCFDGLTCYKFDKWTKGEFEKIISFEANPEFYNRCQRAIGKWGDRAKLVCAGTWDKPCEVRFINDHSAGSKVSDRGGTAVRMESIDNILEGEKTTFIKMDVEGSEYKSLEGARKTIEKYRPRLAISIYHKPEDIVELPYLINEIRDDYRYQLVQYMSDGDETVLYAY